jgi:hypothetical protein
MAPVSLPTLTNLHDLHTERDWTGTNLHQAIRRLAAPELACRPTAEVENDHYNRCVDVQSPEFGT